MAFALFLPRLSVKHAYFRTASKSRPGRLTWYASAHPVQQRVLPSCFPADAADAVTDRLAIRMMKGVSCVKVSVPELCVSPIATTYYCTGTPSEDLPPVMFLHGFDSNLLEYRRLADGMENVPFQCYFVDLLGWGFTEKPPVSSTLSYSPADKRVHLLAWKHAVIGDRPIVLAGASIGGGAAIDFTLHHSKDVEALILIDAQAYTDKEASVAMSVPVFGNALATIGAEVLRSKWLRKLAVSMSYHDEEMRTSDEVERIGGLHTRTVGWLDANVSFIKGKGYCISDKVCDLRLPSLIIYGEKDRILPSEENAARFLEDLGGPEMVTIYRVPEAGHSPHIEKPTDVAWTVANFVRNLRAAAP